MSSPSLLGAHQVTPTRAYSVARVSGVLVTLWALAFGTWIVAGDGQVLATPGWRPMIELFGSYQAIGTILLLAGLLGVAGLAFETNRSRWPRYITLLSCVVGSLWCGVATWQFIVANLHGYTNAGPWLTVPGLQLYVLRFWLLAEVPRPGTAVPYA